MQQLREERDRKEAEEEARAKNGGAIKEKEPEKKKVTAQFGGREQSTALAIFSFLQSF